MQTTAPGVDSLLSVRERFDLTGRIALVTGAAGGIGRATAAAFAELGASVAIADVGPRLDAAEEVAQQIARRFNVKAIAVAADVADEASVVQMVEETSQKLGGLHVVHSNAGIINASDSPDLPLSEWERMLRINLTGMFLVNRTAARLMKDQGAGGSIINTASM